MVSLFNMQTYFKSVILDESAQLQQHLECFKQFLKEPSNGKILLLSYICVSSYILVQHSIWYLATLRNYKHYFNSEFTKFFKPQMLY